MIFLTTGTQEPFDRLLRMVDSCKVLKDQEIVCQSLQGDYHPKQFTIRPEITADEFVELVRQASFIISHAGMGTLISAVEAGKPIVLLPRNASLGEHRNNHQQHTVEKFRHLPNVHVVYNETELRKTLELLWAGVPGIEPGDVKSASLTKYVEHFIAT